MMKKKRILTKFFINNKVRKIVGMVLISLLIIWGSVTGFNSLQNKKEKVSAHPTNTIKLDEGGTNEFEVPTNASSLLEESLIKQTPTYDEYVQGTGGTIPILTKGQVDSFWSMPVPHSEIGWNVVDVRQTRGGNYFVLLGAGGYVSGGVIGVAVVNPLGKCIYLDMQGNLNNTIDRLDTKLFSTSNGSDFLVGTNASNFYRYTLSAESTTAVTVTRESVQLNPGATPQSFLGVGYISIVNSSSNSDKQTSIAGTVYFDNRNNVNANPFVRFKIPVATISVNGWNGVNPNFTFNTQYEYSIDNFVPTDAEAVSGKRYGAVNSLITITQNHVYGMLAYGAGTAGGKTMSTVQIFDKNDSFLENGKKVIRRKVLYENNYVNSKIYMIEELCTEDEIYFFSSEENDSKLIKIELGGTYKQEVIKTYPKDTVLNFVVNPDDSSQIFYFGSTSSLTGELEHPVLTPSLKGNNFYVQGIVDNDFDRKSIYAFPIDTGISPDFMKQGDGKALVFGKTKSNNERFIDKHHQVGETGTVIEDSEPDDTKDEAFMGFVEAKDDFPPAIRVKNNIDVNIADPDLKSTNKNTLGWTCLDNWLITGSKNGTLSDASAVKVFDYMDSANVDFGQTWLEKRINRNPKDIDADIEWEKLGFDVNTAGPQEVTYFVTDSEWQTSTVSRLINKKTPQTFEEDDYVFDAQNFHISLNDIDTTIILDTGKFKELAKTMAWNQENGVIDEDGTDSSKLSTKVTVNVDQLNVLKAATVAKPYPVDVTYKPENGIEIRNRVWVFVTTKNTVPNSKTNPEITPADTNGVVYYADDYSLPYR